MKKKCQIHATFPITCFTVPIIGDTELNLTTDEIYKCLCSKAEVAEVLPDGKLINLDFSNYDKDNFIKEETTQFKEDKNENKEESKSTVKDSVSEEEKAIVLEDKVEIKEETKIEESPVKTHEVSSRNNNYKNNKNRKNNYKK